MNGMTEQKDALWFSQLDRDAEWPTPWWSSLGVAVLIPSCRIPLARLLNHDLYTMHDGGFPAAVNGRLPIMGVISCIFIGVQGGWISTLMALVDPSGY
jgi:hypothetical protein